MSAIGSVIVMGISTFLAGVPGRRRAYGEEASRNLLRPNLCLPGSLGHARQLTPVGHLPNAHSAEAELAVHRLRPSAALAPGVRAHPKLRLLGSLDDQRLLSHVSSP